MAIEKYIHGKVDQSKHEGKRGEIKRLQESDRQLADFYLWYDNPTWQEVSTNKMHIKSSLPTDGS